MKRADHKLIQEVIDGDSCRDRFSKLQERLRNDPEMASLYVDYAKLHHSLDEAFEAGEAAAESSASLLKRRRWVAASGAIAMLILGLLMWFISPSWLGFWQQTEATQVSFSLDAVWTADRDLIIREETNYLANGSTLELIHGRATFSLNSSASVVVDGPAKVFLPTANRFVLEHGSAYFDLLKSSQVIHLTSSQMSFSAKQSRFGVDSRNNGPDEVHVFDGRLEIQSSSSELAVNLLSPGALRFEASSSPMPIPVDSSRFAKKQRQFKSLLSMPFKEQDWRVEYGEPSITSRKVEGDNFAAYLRLPNYKNDHADRVMLVTLQTVDPDVGSFHSEGWAGISFYQDEREVLFVGDPFGPRQTWAMDVQQRVPVHIPTPPVIGARKVTLRYEMQDGSVSLHYGEPPLKLPFCRGNIPPGTWINEIRIGASTGSAIAIRDLSILVSD